VLCGSFWEFLGGSSRESASSLGATSVDAGGMRPQETTNVKCLGCGQVVLGPTVINRLPNGSSCRQCVERVLDAQPSLLKSLPEGVRGPGEGQPMAPILHFPSPHQHWDDPEPA